MPASRNAAPFFFLLPLLFLPFPLPLFPAGLPKPAWRAEDDVDDDERHGVVPAACVPEPLLRFRAERDAAKLDIDWKHSTGDGEIIHAANAAALDGRTMVAGWRLWPVRRLRLTCKLLLRPGRRCVARSPSGRDDYLVCRSAGSAAAAGSADTQDVLMMKNSGERIHRYRWDSK